MIEAARELQDQTDPQATMDESVRLAVLDVDGCDAAALSMVHRSTRIVDTQAASDDMARRGDELQYELGQGPCLDAIWQEDFVHSADLASDARWAKWGPAVAEETNARSLMAFRLFTHDETLGALNLYSRKVGGFETADRDDGTALAAQIAIAVAGARQIAGLGLAVENRTVIGQAQGILMERFKIDAQAAFRVLARLASTSEVKVREIAAQIVAGGDAPALPERRAD